MDVLCLNFVKFGRLEIGEIVRCLSDKKTKFSMAPKLSLLRGSRPKSATASLQQRIRYTKCSGFYSDRFTFGGVIAERVNTAKLRPKVIP